MHGRAPKRLAVYSFTSCRKRDFRATQEHVALVSDNDRLVAQRWNVRAARSARAVDDCNLCQPLRRLPNDLMKHRSIATFNRKDFVHFWQKCSSRIDERNCRKSVLKCDLLGTHMLL